MTLLSESAIESHYLELLQRQGYEHIPPEKQEEECDGDFSQVVLPAACRHHKQTKPSILVETREYALRRLLPLALKSSII